MKMDIYHPKVLASETTVPISNIALEVASKNVVFVIGAGVSKAPPTSLPVGHEIARTLKQKLATTDFADSPKDLSDDDLLTIANVAESKSSEALKLVKKLILDSFDFKTARQSEE